MCVFSDLGGLRKKRSSLFKFLEFLVFLTKEVLVWTRAVGCSSTLHRRPVVPSRYRGTSTSDTDRGTAGYETWGRIRCFSEPRPKSLNDTCGFFVLREPFLVADLTAGQDGYWLVLLSQSERGDLLIPVHHPFSLILFFGSSVRRCSPVVVRQRLEVPKRDTLLLNRPPSMPYYLPSRRTGITWHGYPQVKWPETLGEVTTKGRYDPLSPFLQTP